MQFHVALPNGTKGVSVGFLTEVTVAAKEFGYDGIWAMDHILPPLEFSHRDWRVLEPLTLLAHLAEKSGELRLGSSVIVLPMRDPFLLAKQCAVVDLVSGGRFTLGVGAGYVEAEFRNVGADFHTRGKRMDEALRLLRHLFSGTQSPFVGEFYGYEGGIFDPRPTNGAGLPIVVGGNSRAALRRAARHAEGWQGFALDPAEFAPLAASVRSLAGRTIEVGARVRMADHPEAMRVQVVEWREAGAEYLCFYAAADVLMRKMEAFATDVMPMFD
jgi:probable F420-dependent oxidoreductase